MSDLTACLKRALELNKDLMKAAFEECDVETLSWFVFSAGAKSEIERLAPIHAALVECVEALKKYENVIASQSFDKTDWAAKDALQALDAVLLSEKGSGDE